MSLSNPNLPVGFPERILGWAGGDDPDCARVQLSALRTLLMIHTILEIGLGTYQFQSYKIGLPVFGLVVALPISLMPGRQRMGTVIAAAMVLIIHVLLFPTAANHLMLILLGLLVLAFFDITKDDEALIALASLRWMTLIVLFSTGLQKVLYGTYFQGEFLAWKIAHSDRFTTFWQYAVSAEEIDRLRRLAAGAKDAGVYRTQDLALLLASNASYLAELILPWLLLLRRTRPVALIATVAFLVLVEAGAREVFFGVLFVNLVLLFSSRSWVRALLPASVALYLVSAGSQLGLLPDWNLN